MKVTLVMAQNQYGQTGKDANHLSKDWVPKEDMQNFIRVTKRAGVIIMGNNTFKTIGKGLTGRIIVVLTRSPDDKPKIDGVVYSNDTPEEILASLSEAGYTEVALCGGPQINSLFYNHITDAVITTVQTEEKWANEAVYMFADPERSIELKEEDVIETSELTSNAIVRTYEFT